MMDDDRIREVAAAMARAEGQEFESLRAERQIHWYCRARFAVDAIEGAGFEVRRKKVRVSHKGTKAQRKA